MKAVNLSASFAKTNQVNISLAADAYRPIIVQNMSGSFISKDGKFINEP